MWCTHCGEEIFRNESVPGGGWIWESELLLGFCDGTKDKKDKKHKPVVKKKKNPEEEVSDA